MSQSKAVENAKLKALREAAQIGLDAMAAGRFRRFDDKELMNEYLLRLAEEAIGRAHR